MIWWRWAGALEYLTVVLVVVAVVIASGLGR